MTPLTRFIIRVILLALPIFGLWWISIPVILSILAVPVSTLTAHWFEREQVTIEVTEERWLVHTKILEKQPIGQTSQVLVLKLEKKMFISFIMGLPLLWILLLAASGTLKEKLWKLLIGNIFLSIPIILTLHIRIVYFLGILMSGDNVGQILVMDGLYQTVQPYSVEILAIFNGFTKLMAYVNFLVFPAVISYFLHREFVSHLLKKLNQCHEITS